MTYDYFYGQQAEMFAFYRVPKVLFTEDCFWNVSTDAKLLYGILLDRMNLSARNGWLDEGGRVYIIFTIEEIKGALGCAEKKAVKLLDELEILDDFGMERGTDYGLEQVFNVIDSRYRSGKPLIVTTNLTLDDLRNPEDTAHSRIYDRLLSMCVPVRFTGDNFRQETAKRKMESMKKLITD